MSKRQPADGSRKRELFLRALEKENPAERTAFLDRASAGDAELRAAVEALLRGHQQDSFLEHPAVTTDPRAPIVTASITDKPGDCIGRYKLLEKLGEGGFGVVYMAEQREPVKRRIALKIIKVGMDTREVVARFEAERQALALMDHPNIARVLDAGSTERPLAPGLSLTGGESARRAGEGDVGYPSPSDRRGVGDEALSPGRPYFVMELVRGIRITEYCDQNQLGLEERLKLFMQVCHAVQHAHQKGIIHRDLKPSNILVTLHDGVPVPKVIDFGIAKATQQELTEKTLFTQFHQFIGTPSYMSPEQAELSGLDIDTRSDIYSLGVVLYELLTGTTPFDGRELLKAGLDEMRRTIREKEPVKPSTRLTHERMAARSVVSAQSRIAQDLDWIVMKCLEKDRTRRYETASGLAADILRHLNNEPVAARPPSAAYRFQKLVRRHKMTFTAAAAVFVVLVGGVAVSTWQAVRATQATRIAAQKSALADLERKRAEENLYAADMREAQAALESGNLGRVRQLVEAHRPKPQQADLRGFEWRLLWSRSRGDAAYTLARRVGWVNSVAFSPDGRLLAARNMDHTLRVWDLASRRELFAINEVAGFGGFSSDSKTLAFGALDGSVKLSEADTGRTLHSIGNAGQIVTLLADGTTVATTSEDFAVATWEFATGKRLQVVPGVGGLNRIGSEFGAAVAISPDGARLAIIEPASEGPNAQISLWDVATRNRLRTLLIHGRVTFLKFSADGGTLAAGSVDGVVQLWDALSGTETLRPIQAHADTIFAGAFSPGARLLATGSEDETIGLWQTSTGRSCDTLKGHEVGVWALAFSPDGKWVASGSQDGTVRIWEVERTRRPQALATLSPNLTAFEWQHLAWSPDSRLLAAACQDDAVKIWDAASLEPRRSLPGASQALSFSRDGETLLTGFRDGAVASWHFATRNLGDATPARVAIEGRPCLAVSADGQQIASAALSGIIELCDVVSGRRDQLTGHARQVAALGFSRDGRLLVSGGWDGTIKLWDVARRQSVADLADPTASVNSPVTAAVLSPDTEMLATGSTDRSIKIWDLKTNRRLLLLNGHKGPVWALAFSPDGRTLASGSGDHTVRLWSVVLRQEVAALKSYNGARRGPEEAIVHLQFSPDGNTLATLTRGGRLRLWRAASTEEAAAEDDGTRR